MKTAVIIVSVLFVLFVKTLAQELKNYAKEEALTIGTPSTDTEETLGQNRNYDVFLQTSSFSTKNPIKGLELRGGRPRTKTPGTYRRLSVNSKILDSPSLDDSTTEPKSLSLLAQNLRGIEGLKEAEDLLAPDQDGIVDPRQPKLVNVDRHVQTSHSSIDPIQKSGQPINLIPLSLGGEKLEYPKLQNFGTETRKNNSKPVIVLPLKPYSYSDNQTVPEKSYYDQYYERKPVNVTTTLTPINYAEATTESFTSTLVYSEIESESSSQVQFELESEQNKHSLENYNFNSSTPAHDDTFENLYINSLKNSQTNSTTLTLNSNSSIQSPTTEFTSNSTFINSNSNSLKLNGSKPDPPAINSTEIPQNSSFLANASETPISTPTPPIGFAISPIGSSQQPLHFGGPSSSGGFGNFGGPNFGFPSTPGLPFSELGHLQTPNQPNASPNFGGLGLSYLDILRTLGISLNPEPYPSQSPLLSQFGLGGGVDSAGNAGGLQNFGQFDTSSFGSGADSK